MSSANGRATAQFAVVCPNRKIDRILALDPGLCDIGLASVEQGRLTGAWWVRTHRQPARCKRCAQACDHATRPLAIGRTVAEALLTAGPIGRFDLVVAEWPKVYLGRKVAANPDDLLAMAGVVGAVNAAAALDGVATWHVLPEEWKGRERKDIFQTWILACLRDEELALIPRGAIAKRYASDAVDAVGLGMWAAGRLGTWLRPPQHFAALVEPPAKAKAKAKARGKKLPGPVAGLGPLFATKKEK